jgi:hypothetical protein
LEDLPGFSIPGKQSLAIWWDPARPGKRNTRAERRDDRFVITCNDLYLTIPHLQLTKGYGIYIVVMETCFF